jgi:hypothetical protein
MAALIGGSKFQAAQIATGTGAVSTLSSLVNTRYGIFNAYSTINNSKNLEQDNRLTATETRLSSIEIDIEGVVSSVVTTQIAQTTFDTLRAELTNVNSDLSLTLATKVAQTLQYELDSAQNSSISTVQANLDAYETSNDAAFGAYSTFNNQTVADNLSTFNAYVASNDAALSTAIADAYEDNVNVQNNLTDYSVATNSTIAANLSSFNAYVASNDAAFGAYSTFNDNTVSTLRVDFSTYSSFNNQVVADNLSTFNAYVASNDASLAAVSTLLVNYEATNDAALGVTNANHTAYVASNNAALAQVSTNLGVYATTNDATVADHYSTFNTYVASNDAAVAENLSTFNAYVESNDAAVAENLSTFNAYVESNDAAVASKVAQTAYNAKMSSVDLYSNSWDRRFVALEEFVRAMLKTYDISKEDGSIYEYTGIPQQINIYPTRFEITSRTPTPFNNGWVFNVSFSEYAMNTFFGTFDVTFPNMLNTFSYVSRKQDIYPYNNSTTYWFNAYNPATPTAWDSNRTEWGGQWNNAGAQLPLTFRMKDRLGNVIEQLVINEQAFSDIPIAIPTDVQPETPTNVSYNTTTKQLTFSLAHPQWIDFVDIRINNDAFWKAKNYSITPTGTVVTIDMTHATPVPVSSLEIFVRYDMYLNGEFGNAPANDIGVSGYYNLTIIPDGFEVEQPSDVTYNAGTSTLQFTIPHPQWIDFIDVVLDDNGSLAASHLNYSILGTTVTINTTQFPQAPTTKINIYLRYDKYTGNSTSGTYIYTIA